MADVSDYILLYLKLKPLTQRLNFNAFSFIHTSGYVEIDVHEVDTYKWMWTEREILESVDYWNNVIVRFCCFHA